MKKPVLAAIDIGNSGARVALLQNLTVLDWRRLEKKISAKVLRGFFREEGVGTVDGAVVCSVVPQLTDAARAALRAASGRSPIVISSRLRTGLRLRYRTPETLGTDRLCAAAAAYARYGGPLIIVDLGTATTIDCVTRKGEYLGGAIVPGIATSARALHAATAQLPMIDFAVPSSPVGDDTRTSLQSGIIYGALGAIEGLVGRFRKIAGRKTVVVATGGFAPLAASQSAVIDIVNPHLVLEGAALLWQKNKTG